MSDILNISVGLLGHVDCGKTSLAKVLSTTSSTACFDKNPQSQERGITLDLGFSSFNITPASQKFSERFKEIQLTLVDCPGHASLIRTIIGGSQIINIALLVIDINKGIETQTAECLVISEITCAQMIIVLNKIDLIDEASRDRIISRTQKKLKSTLLETKFKNVPIIPVSANIVKPIGIDSLKQALLEIIDLPPSCDINGPMIMAVDHCFSIRGQGTIFTGNILQGCVSVNDIIEIPQLQMKKKVKSIQIFHKNVSRAIKGDRLGICVTQLDSKLFERGLVTSENCLKCAHACVIDFNVIKYYKQCIKSKSKYHISVGYQTILAKITLFQTESEHLQTNRNPYLKTSNVDDLDIISGIRKPTNDEMKNAKEAPFSQINNEDFNSDLKVEDQSNLLNKVKINEEKNKSVIKAAKLNNPINANVGKLTSNYRNSINEEFISKNQINVKNSNLLNHELSENDLKLTNKNSSLKNEKFNVKKNNFKIEETYLYIDEISRDDIKNNNYFALLEFDKPLLLNDNHLIIGSKLDLNIHTTSCRLSFYGNTQYIIRNNKKNEDKTTSELKIHKNYTKFGSIDRIINSKEIICKNLFDKNQLNVIENIFLNFYINLQSGQLGKIENIFGKSGKLKVILNEEINQEQNSNTTVMLKYRKDIFTKRIFQSL